MFSREDPWVNVLRSTLAAFGASVGGAEAITVLPYDTVAGLPERFSRRLARNTQILLADESNVGRVTDPGGGSWYLESLTDQVAAAVWARFQEIEAAGGVVARDRRRPAPRVGSAATSERALGLATRRTPLTGVSTFPLAGEAPADPPPTPRPRRYRPGPPRPAATPRSTRPCATARGRSATARPSSSARSGPSGTPVLAPDVRREPPRRGRHRRDRVRLDRRRHRVEPLAGTPSTPPQAVADLRAAGAQVVLVAGRTSELGDDAGLVDGELYDGMDVVAVLDALLTRLETEGAR